MRCPRIPGHPLRFELSGCEDAFFRRHCSGTRCPVQRRQRRRALCLPAVHLQFQEEHRLSRRAQRRRRPEEQHRYFRSRVCHQRARQGRPRQGPAEWQGEPWLHPHCTM